MKKKTGPSTRSEEIILEPLSTTERVTQLSVGGQIGEGETGYNKIMYKKALLFATEAHAGQKRNNGNNYIIHPIRVSQEVHTEVQRVCALLHDVVEDTDVDLIDIKMHFGVGIADTINCLTHRKGESYHDYITRVLEDDDAVAVKIADICDNLSDTPSERAIEKSAQALERLAIGDN